MSRVTVIYGNDAQRMVERLIAATGVLDTLRPDDTVVVKPNLVVSRPDWVGVNTDPRVVEALLKAIKDRGVRRITIGDGSGTGHNAAKAFQICGYADLARRYGLRLVDLEKDRFVKKKVPIDGPFATLEIARTVLECNVLINVPVMKAHTETLITCSLKNFKGVMPRKMKTAFHRVDLHRAIAQLASVLSPDLILVDGLQGDLSSEIGHNPVVMETILLGTNSVEVDSVAANMLGYSPRTIRHIAHSADANLGNCHLGEITIHRLNRPSRDDRFTPAPRYTRRFPCQIRAEGACCTCLGNLIFALERLHERGFLSKKQHFFVGQKLVISQDKAEMTIAIGQCAVKQVNADIRVEACPPTASAIYHRVASASRCR
jgi:uncharacterized protein (DUF362 family)